MLFRSDSAGTHRGKAGSGGVELSAAASLQSLWESDDSVNHDPYYNVFSGSSGSAVNYGQAHKTWSKQVVRERVWQTLKDVKAMERHVREQNALNNKMKVQITTLEQEAQNEKEVIRKLIAAGMADVTEKISILKNAALTNVTDVREMLMRIEAEQKSKQAQQDTAIDQLTARHQQLQQQTTSKFKAVDSQISEAEKRLAEAKARVASEREEVKKLIMEKIRTDVGGLDKEMTDRLENEKYDIRTTIDSGLKQLDGNISDYSLQTGIRVARLMNKVAVLKKDQATKAGAQDERIRTLEDDHKELKDQTLGTLSTLRTEVEDTKSKLAKAQETLEAEQALRQSAEEKSLDKDTAKLKAATEQSLADAKDAVALKIGDSDAWAHKAYDSSKASFGQSVDALKKQLGDFVKVTKKASAGQEDALEDAKAKTAEQLSDVQKQADDEQEQVTQTQAAVAAGKAQLLGEVADDTKQLRLKLLNSMTALHQTMSTSLAHVRAQLQDKMHTDNADVTADLVAAKETASGAMASVKADLVQTQTEATKSQDRSKAEIARLAASENALSQSTAADILALRSQIQGVEASLAASQKKLTAQADAMEAHLRGKLDAGLKGLDTSVASAMTQSRVEVEKKMSGDVAALRSEVADAKAGSEAAADKLHAKVERVETATHAAWAARQAQVAAVSKDHADFEAHATTTLAHVKDSLSHTKAMLTVADASMHKLLEEREAALKSQVQGQMTALADDAKDKVAQEAKAVQEAHDALSAALAAHQAATKASVEQRKQKLEALAADLQALQAKMTAVEAMSAEKAGPVTQLAASHAHIPGVKPKAKGASAKGKQAAGKAAAAHAHDVESHDVAARDPRPLPGMNHADQHSRGSATGAVQAGYWSRS